jgi:Family of unknown function (DUF5309)
VPPFQGLRGSRSYSADAIPKNWREGILRLYPNGGAVLTALSALLEAEQTSDPEFNWWERPLPIREAYTAGGTAVVTTLAVSSASGGIGDPGKIFRKGYILQVVGTGGTGEKLLVTADQTVGTSVAVQRQFGETVAAIIPANAILRVVGNANEEGAPTGTPVAVDPVKQFNYTQIFRTPLHITRTAKKTRLRTEDAIVQAQIEALENQAQDMEYSFLFGERLETTGTLGQPMRTTRGIVPWIKALAPGNATTAGATTSEDQLLAALEPMYRFGSAEKLWLVGSRAMMVLTKIAKNGSQLNLEAGDDVYGIRVRQFVTAFGDGYIRQHPLFNLYSDWRGLILVIDLPHVSYRYVDDLQYLEHRQAPGDDALKNEWLAECGLELHHAVAHGVIEGVTAAAPAAMMVPGAEFQQPALPGAEQPALPEGQAGQPMPATRPAGQPARTQSR